MKYVKAFMAGIVVPSIILPIILFFALLAGRPQVLTIPLLHFIPLFWGIWNMLYFAFFKKAFPGKVKVRLLLTGGLLGLLVAICGVFLSDFPAAIGLPRVLDYLPLILAPVIYALLWLYVVKPLNDLVGLSTPKEK